MSDRGGRGASVAMIATSWEVGAGCSLSITIRAHLDLVLVVVCTYAAYHVAAAGAAIPTGAVWRQQLWSGEVVHLEPPALQTSTAVLFSYRVLQSNPPLMAQSTRVLSLPALTAVAVLSLPDYSGRPWEWGQTDPHQPMLGSSLPLGC